MSVTKPQTETTDTPAPQVAEEPTTNPDKQAGPLAMASRFASASSGTGAPARARNASMMQRSIGNARLSRMANETETPQPEKRREEPATGIQTLAVSSPNDPSEQEAESVARRVSAGQNAPPI